MIRDCLSAAGITTVVWIDDFFSTPSRDELLLSIFKFAHQLKETGKAKIEIPAFAAVDLTQSKELIEDACDDAISKMDDRQVTEVEQAMAELSGATKVASQTEPDLLPEDFNALRQAFGNTLRTFSLGNWTSSGVLEFSGAPETTLFLIDREFRREGAGFDGTDVLAELIDSTSAFCIMLTHTCSEAGQESLRVEIANQRNIPSYRFCVLSKQQNVEAGGIDPRFERAIYTVMTHRFTGEIADIVRKAIEESAETTALELTRQSALELDRVLFENSYDEGVLEFDVLRRVFGIQHRYAVNNTLRHPMLQSRLRAAREFRQKTGNLRAQWPAAAAAVSVFRDWRMREVFEEGEGLNQTHTPLACGDVFESGTEGPKRYVFLAQPCDVMVRKTGKRRAEVGLLALVSEAVEKPEQDSPSGHRFFDISGVFGAARKWRVDFQNVAVVDLFVLDFAVFNSDGRVQLTRLQPEPDIVLAKGWLKRLRKAKAQVFESGSLGGPPPLGMGEEAITLKGEVVDGCLRYPLRRVGRLEANTANAILAAWATFQTRAALEHDFAKEPEPNQTPALPGLEG